MKEEEHFEDQDEDDKNRNLDFEEMWLDIFVCIYLAQDREIGRLLCARYWTFGFH